MWRLFLFPVCSTLVFSATGNALCGPAPYAQVPCDALATQTAVLEALYAATNGAEWTNNENWLVGDPCDNKWFGITCDGSHTVQCVLA